MGITGVPFGRTEVLVPPPEPHERALARGKGPRGPGINRFRKKCKNVLFFCHFGYDFFLAETAVSPISGFEPFSKKSKKSRQGDHSNFEFLECCLKNADDPPGGGAFGPPSPGGSLHTLATEKFEIRVIALSGFFGFFGKRFETRNRRNRK